MNFYIDTMDIQFRPSSPYLFLQFRFNIAKSQSFSLFMVSIFDNRFAVVIKIQENMKKLWHAHEKSYLRLILAERDFSKYFDNLVFS